MQKSNSKLNILVAYPYFKKDVVNLLENTSRDSFNLIVDSGAFTAWNTGREITMEGYCAFLDSISHLRPFHAVSFDVFGNAKASWENFLTMKERGYDVMPVFTRGEDESMLDKMYNETDYIMFGGVVIGRGNRNYVKWFEEVNHGRKSHWLGFVNMKFIKHYRPTSVDSSSWRQSARYGGLPLYRGGGEMTSFKKADFATRPTKKMLELAKLHGLTEKEFGILRYKDSWIDSGSHDGDLSIEKENKRTSAQFIGTLAHVLRSFEVEKKLGTKIYLAAATSQQVKLLFQAVDFLKERGILK